MENHTFKIVFMNLQNKEDYYFTNAEGILSAIEEWTFAYRLPMHKIKVIKNKMY